MTLPPPARAVSESAALGEFFEASQRFEALAAQAPTALGSLTPDAAADVCWRFDMAVMRDERCEGPCRY